MKSYLEFLVKFKPVLFINFAYTVEDGDGKDINFEDTLKELIDSEFIKPNEIHFYDGDIYANNIKLDEYSLIFYGLVGENFENYHLVETYCKTKMLPFIAYGKPDHLDNKFLQSQVFHANKLPTPNTVTSIANGLNVDFIKERFDFPIVLKIAHGSQGKGVELINGEETLKLRLKELGDEKILIQNFIPNNCDYRVFFIGDQHIFNIKRTRVDKDEFRNNVSLGGKGTRAVLDWLPLSIATKAHKAMGFYFAGVDLMQDKKTKEWYVIEVNSAPQFNVFKTLEVLKIIVEHINKLKK